MKTCSRCNQTKPEDAFGLHKTYGRQAWCRACMSEYCKSPKQRQKAAERRARDAEKVRQRKKVAYRNNKDRVWEQNIMKKYGITADEYFEMLNEQENTCALCDREHAGELKRLAVDHCHKTGKVRGLLCEACNRALGMFHDDVERLFKAIDYLTKHKE